MGIQIMREEPGKAPKLHAGYDCIGVGVAVKFLEQAAGQECDRRGDAQSVRRADTTKDGLRHYRINVIGADARTLASYFLTFDEKVNA